MIRQKRDPCGTLCNSRNIIYATRPACPERRRGQHGRRIRIGPNQRLQKDAAYAAPIGRGVVLDEVKTMDSHKDNFNAWYAGILKGLYEDRNAGFVILMVAFPLLERYLRQKSGVHKNNLDRRFSKQLTHVFPELGSESEAGKFWQVYRHGLLHQVTFSQKNAKGIKLPRGWVSNDVAAVWIDSHGDFWVHPSKFAKRVIRTIENDFTVFEGQHSADHQLPTVQQCSRVLGTGAPSQKPPVGYNL